MGKTWIMKEFGKQEYKSVAYVNCDNEPKMAHLFETDYDIDRIVLGLQAITGVKIVPGETLLILDEIQEVKRGLSALKYFCENAPQYHVMVAGSLLGIALHQGESFPVGKVNFLDLYPMDFEEFLDALGEIHWIEILQSSDWQLISAMSDKFIDFLRQYYFVGGMPEVVSSYIKEKDLAKVRTIQNEILFTYKNDISKHAPQNEVVRINMVLHSLPSQLAKDNKKFIYGVMKKGARAADYELAIQWLVDCGIIYKVNRIKSPKIPLAFYEDMSAFKLFLLDCELFAAMSGAPASEMLIGNNVFEEFKGAFTEEYVIQQLKSEDDLYIYYWSSDTADAELDFIIQKDNKVLPIEVKAEENLRARSLAQYIKTYPELHGIRFSMSNYREQDWLTNVPLYALTSFVGSR